MILKWRAVEKKLVNDNDLIIKSQLEIRNVERTRRPLKKDEKKSISKQSRPRKKIKTTWI